MTDSATQSAIPGLDAVLEALRNGKIRAGTQLFREMAAGADAPSQAGEALGRGLRGLLADFQVDAVMTFTAWLKSSPADEIADPAVEGVQPLLDRIVEWRTTLADIANEREARDIRNHVRNRDLDAALVAVQRYVSHAPGKKARSGRARQLGIILGSLNVDRKRTAEVVKQLAAHPKRYGLDESDLPSLKENYEQTLSGMSLTAMGEHERQWDRMSTDAIVQMMRPLPSTDVERPGEEHERRVYEQLLVVIAAWFADAENAEDLGLDQADVTARFLDLARLLREFCPSDGGTSAAVEGVEEVAFLRMSPAGKLTSVRALRRLGRSPQLVKSILWQADKVGEGRPLEIVLFIMGGLANPAFVARLIAALDSAKYKRIHEAVVDALGRIGDEPSLKRLFKRLQEQARSRVIDPPTRKRLMNCLAALGRIARHPDTPAEKRDAIAKQIFKVLPDDRPVGRAAVEHLCGWNPSGLSEETRRLAIRRALANLWTRDSGTGQDQPDANRRTDLGFREQMTTILIEMGPKSLQMILEEAERYALQYSGAYAAIAEVFGKIGDERALPFLEKILRVAVTMDTSEIPEHLRETYYDAATEQQVSLSKDHVAYAIVYAIRQAGGEKGLAILRQLADQIRAGRLPEPGPETMEYLAAQIVGSGGEVAEAEPQSGQPPANETRPLGDSETPPLGDLDAEMSGLGALDGVATSAPVEPEDTGREDRPRGDDSLKKLIKDILGKGLFTTKMERRVMAIQEVAARRAVEAVPALCRLLLEDDKILVAAAQRAILEIVHPSRPRKPFREALYALLGAMRGMDGREVKRVALTVDKLKPERSPIREMILEFVKIEDAPRLRKDVADLFRLADERLKRSGTSLEAVTGGDSGGGAQSKGDSPGKPAAGAGGKGMSAEQKMDAKRQYFAARRAWIDGGKNGPEPPRPEGV